MRRRVDTKFHKFSEKVWQRDDYTCRFCGFKSQKCLEVVNKDGNYLNNSMSNMVSACILCCQCCFINLIGEDDFNGGGYLIYLPELTQAELNSFCYVIFYTIAENLDCQNKAHSLYRDLKLRAQVVEKHLGDGMSDPMLFTEMVYEKGAEKRIMEMKILADFRLLPIYAKFKEGILTWISDQPFYFKEIFEKLE